MPLTTKGFVCRGVLLLKGWARILKLDDEYTVCQTILSTFVYFEIFLNN